MDEQSGTSSSASRVVKEAQPQEVRYIDRPCILPGHEYHSMHECKTLRLQAQQAKQAQQHVQHSHGRGSRGEHISMHTPNAMHSNATYNHNTSTHDAQQAGLQQQIADLSRAVQGMHALLTTQIVGAGLGGGLQKQFCSSRLPTTFCCHEHSATTKCRIWQRRWWLRSRPWRWWPHPRTLLALQLVWKAAPSSGYVLRTEV